MIAATSPGRRGRETWTLFEHCSQFLLLLQKRTLQCYERNFKVCPQQTNNRGKLPHHANNNHVYDEQNKFHNYSRQQWDEHSKVITHKKTWTTVEKLAQLWGKQIAEDLKGTLITSTLHFSVKDLVYKLYPWRSSFTNQHPWCQPWILKVQRFISYPSNFESDSKRGSVGFRI